MPALFGLVALVFVVYWPAFAAGFIYLDDPSHIFKNPVVTGGITWDALTRAFQPHASLWTPLTWISHMLVVEFAGLDPFWHHLVNVVLHAVSVLLLFGWILRVTHRFWTAFAVAALFAVHPLNVENVVWATERNHLLAMVFLLLALHAYTSHVTRATSGDTAKTSVWMRLTELGMLLSIMSKGTFVTFPVLLLILDAWPFHRLNQQTSRRVVSEKIGLFAIALFSMVMTFSALNPEAMPGGQMSLISRICVALTTLGWQAVRIVIPYVLSPIHPQPRELLWMEAMVSAVALILVAYAGWRCRKRAPWVLAGVAWYMVVLAPLSGISQVGNTFFSDRFVYLPEIGLFVAAAFSLTSLSSRMRHGTPIGVACLALVTLAYGATTHWYARQWKDSARLFTHAASVTKNNFIAHTTAALAFVRSGDLQGAIPHFEAGLRVNPDAVNFRYQYAEVLARTGRTEDAASHFQSVIARDPRSVRARFGLAAAQLRMGRSAEALANLRILKEQQFTAPDLDQMIEKAAVQAQREQSSEGSLPRESNRQPRSVDDLR